LKKRFVFEEMYFLTVGVGNHSSKRIKHVLDKREKLCRSKKALRSGFIYDTKVLLRNNFKTSSQEITLGNYQYFLSRKL